MNNDENSHGIWNIIYGNLWSLDGILFFFSNFVEKCVFTFVFLEG